VSGVGGVNTAGGAGLSGSAGMAGGAGMSGSAGMGGSGAGASGSAGMGGDAGMAGSAGTGGSTGGMFTLTSSELMDGAAFLPKHTCAVAGFDNDESPPLAWSGAPPETLSYALVFLDRTLIDDDNDLGYHWAVWNIPPTITELPANLGNNQPAEASHSRASYLGPCPNFGAGAVTDTYEFILYAMPTATVELMGMLNEQMLATLEADSLASATLTGTSDASPP
jgi:phosphatidylethanolamine-binding protein (PEBP) family uncharacterized protein